MKYLVLILSTLVIGGCASSVQQSYLDGSDAYLAGDYELARQELQECATAKFRQCNYILGRIAYAPKDMQEAIKHFKKDAELGHKESQAFLALSLYMSYLDYQSTNQIPPKDIDLSEAISWIWVAKKQGYNDSANLFSTLNFALAKERGIEPDAVPILMLEKLKSYEELYILN
ncbi:TPA: hypothetical protein AB5H59_003626 [Vibrio mimicus]